MEFSVRKEGVMKYTAKFVLQKNSKYLSSYCIKYRIVLYYNNIKCIYKILNFFSAINILRLDLYNVQNSKLEYYYFSLF